MANSPAAPLNPLRKRVLGAARISIFSVLVAALAVCLIFLWLTRGAMANFSFLNSRSQGPSASLVSTQPWDTAQALAALAVSSEEQQLAHEAEHLADHSVDQAFAAALRQAHLDAQHRTLTGNALALQQRITQLEQLRQQDQAQVDKLSAKTPAGKNGAPAASDDQLQVAKAQLGLDNDEIGDAQRDLERASGDLSARIQDELAAHEESMRKYDSEVASGQLAIISASADHTLAARVGSWLKQRQRVDLIQQARQQALDDVGSITAQHNAIEARLSGGAAAADSGPSTSAQIAQLHDRSAEREILSIDDDRIQTEQQLANVYAKWSVQLHLQHQIVVHLILDSVVLILVILLATFACDAAVRRVMDRPAVERRQMRTLRNVLQLAIQLVGAILILLVVFGAPRETPTILGLTTAALTIALQDYIVAFLGWFSIMGRNGVHVGDWVEINGVGGEVIEIRLMTTTLLETGKLSEHGFPTGRRITFMNSFAIRGQYFNFSTAGQWMWDEISITLPVGADIHALSQRVEHVLEEETRDDSNRAEKEWKQQMHGRGLSHFSVAPVVNLRPSASAIELQARYVTSAAGHYELRNRLYARILDILREPADADSPRPATT